MKAAPHIKGISRSQHLIQAVLYDYPAASHPDESGLVSASRVKKASILDNFHSVAFKRKLLAKHCIFCYNMTYHP